MAVFISASDEHSGGDGRGMFLFAGYVGPEKDWSQFFVPAWQQRVLDGPPQIPYLHMTEIRSKQFREKWGLSRLRADDRVNEAATVLTSMGSFYPISVEANGGFVKDAFKDSKVVRSNAKQFEAKPFEPDYVCFLAYAYVVLNYVHDVHPHAEKVDFIVEKKGVVTRYIQDFHSTLDKAIAAIGHPELSPLIGELIPAGKERIPCQAADVLCWHAGRFENAQEVKNEDIGDARRYLKLRGRSGKWLTLSDDLLAQMGASLLEGRSV